MALLEGNFSLFGVSLGQLAAAADGGNFRLDGGQGERRASDDPGSRFHNLRRWQRAFADQATDHRVTDAKFSRRLLDRHPSVLLAVVRQTMVVARVVDAV